MLLDNILKHNKIIIFGTGKMSKDVSNNIPYKIKYYVDNNQKKWGNSFQGALIYSPERLVNEAGNVKIIVASSYFSEISDQLEQLGFEENVDFFNGVDYIHYYNKEKERDKLPLNKFSSKSLIKIYHYIKGHFDREILATHEGIKVKRIEDFRRNIHRIEKGLTMKNSKEVFALNYIEETVNFYCDLIKSSNITNTTIWANDVLSEYFKVIRKTFYLTILEKNFLDASKKLKIDKKEYFKPYLRKKQKINISYEEFYTLSKYRRSVRYYKDYKVSRDLIDKAIELAIESPSACNRQPFHFKVIDDKSLLDKVIKLPKGVLGYGDQIPHLAIIIGNLASFSDVRDRHLIYIDASLAAMTFIYALEIQNISSCIINWPDIEELEKEMQVLLNLDYFERPIMLIGFGYADHNIPVAFSAKKSISKIRSFNLE
ncbi:nitroreductase family protein [Gracilibacillus lacisalsi]|uniref:nitroreductase family protein n=1 Tax=Gracilibacillus lacisalsi TaxID=393087 RepID=UPI00037B5BDC|nr:nitroreductase family protein [Gracilibacillus lacisalsi]